MKKFYFMSASYSFSSGLTGAPEPVLSLWGNCRRHTTCLSGYTQVYWHLPCVLFLPGFRNSFRSKLRILLHNRPRKTNIWS